MQATIEVAGLRKRFGPVLALDGMSFTVQPGQVTGFVGPAEWSPQAVAGLLWWVAAALALRCVFEPVMVAYYLWPVLAVALVTASGSWSRLVATSLVASTLTFVAQASWRGPWIWWGSVVAGLALTLLLAAPHGRATGARRTSAPPSQRPLRLPMPSDPSAAARLADGSRPCSATRT